MSLWNGFLGLLFLAVCAKGRYCCAQDTSAVEIPQNASSRQVLVLRSGRVLDGKIKPRGTGYELADQNGILFFGSADIWLLADSLPEAHQGMRDSFSVLTPDIHMQIAAWCVDNQLWGTARRELLDALHKDPYREEARQMLARVIQQQDTANGSLSVTEPTTVTDAIAARTILARRSLGGLPPELAQDFTRQIQRMLSHKCSSCHGAGSDRIFVIESIRKGSSPVIAKRNLIAILNQLDPAKAEPDEFLKMALTQHGSMESVPFPGQVGSILRDRLSFWVERVRQEKGFSSVQRSSWLRPTIPSADAGVSQVVHQPQPHQDSSVTTAELLVQDANPHELIRSVKETATEMLADASRRNRIDKFDPDRFNQRYRFRSDSSDADSGLANRRSP